MNFLSRENTIALPGYNRWLVPPAALAIHLCIGMAYGFSVFWIPLSRAVGISHVQECLNDQTFFQSLTAVNCDWKISALGWTFTLFFVFLGSSAALFGHWLETAGPRKAALASAVCWCGGLVISALGVYLHQIWMLWLGSGVVGGIGLGLGYISPVSTLIKWFPDRRGLATGLAIMGFGGGAMIGAPLSDKLMRFFASPTSVGVWETFLTLAIIYFIFMVAGALSYRVPADDWLPDNWTPQKNKANSLVTHRHVHLSQSWKTPQFWLLWAILCLNVSAGIGVLGMASPMLQEVFGGKLIGLDQTFDQLNEAQKAQIAAIAAGFTGLLSLCNIAGRLGWASASDRLGRKFTYAIFFILGFLLYALAPWAATIGSKFLFVSFFCIILTMYGGGFSTIPAYLADLFGTHMVGAIHGRLLTAWSTAGVLGPILVNYIREYQLSIGVPREAAYNQTLYVLAALLILGLICDLLVRPVSEKFFMNDDELKTPVNNSKHRNNYNDGNELSDFEDAVEERKSINSLAKPASHNLKKSQITSSNLFLYLSWLVVGVPMAWGLYNTLNKALQILN